MKTVKLIIAGIFLFLFNLSFSQVSINVNIGTPVVRVPVQYSNVDYYYLPDVQAYYDIRASQYIYLNQGNWCRASYLPGPYRDYDLYRGRKVILNDYHGSRPYVYYNNHKAKYHNYYKGNSHNKEENYSNYYSYNDNRYRENRNDYENHEYRESDRNGYKKHKH